MICVIPSRSARPPEAPPPSTLTTGRPESPSSSSTTGPGLTCRDRKSLSQPTTKASMSATSSPASARASPPAQRTQSRQWAPSRCRPKGATPPPRMRGLASVIALYPWIICLGSHVANSGKMISSASTIRSKKMNGITPRATWRKSASFPTAPSTANRLIPTGGVTTDISINLTSTMPNQMGSISSVVTTGNRNGKVTIIIEVVSRKQPSTM